MKRGNGQLWQTILFLQMYVSFCFTECNVKFGIFSTLFCWRFLLIIDCPLLYKFYALLIYCFTYLSANCLHYEQYHFINNNVYNCCFQINIYTFWKFGIGFPFYFMVFFSSCRVSSVSIKKGPFMRNLFISFSPFLRSFFFTTDFLIPTKLSKNTSGKTIKTISIFYTVRSIAQAPLDLFCFVAKWSPRLIFRELAERLLK